MKKSKTPSKWTGRCRCGGKLTPVGKGHRNKNYAWCTRCGRTVVADEPDLTMKEILADAMKEGAELADKYKLRAR